MKAPSHILLVTGSERLFFYAPSSQTGNVGHHRILECLRSGIWHYRGKGVWKLYRLRAFHQCQSQPSLMNFCVTDGETVVAIRYVSSKVDEAASLVSLSAYETLIMSEAS